MPYFILVVFLLLIESFVGQRLDLALQLQVGALSAIPRLCTVGKPTVAQPRWPTVAKPATVQSRWINLNLHCQIYHWPTKLAQSAQQIADAKCY